MSNLLDRRCIDYPKGSPCLTQAEQVELGKEVPEWRNIEGTRIQREYKFNTYLEGVYWIQEVAKIAEAENHHPDIRILYRKVILELWTHTVKGLSENDFILAAKFDQIFSTRSPV
jgi:4a-hydroxytetrahydrobiopterin dehydratase